MYISYNILLITDTVIITAFIPLQITIHRGDQRVIALDFYNCNFKHVKHILDC